MHGHFELELGAHFKLEWGGQYGWNLHLITEDNHNLYFNDLRFGLLNDNPKHPQFAFSYLFTSGYNGKLGAKEVPKAKRDGKALLKKIFTRIKGN